MLERELFSVFFGGLSVVSAVVGLCHRSWRSSVIFAVFLLACFFSDDVI